jgi:hypothetical protein
VSIGQRHLKVKDIRSMNVSKVFMLCPDSWAYGKGWPWTT